MSDQTLRSEESAEPTRSELPPPAAELIPAADLLSANCVPPEPPHAQVMVAGPRMVVQRPDPVPPPPTYSLARLLWLVTVVAVMMGVYTLVPRLAEEINYSLTRGSQRAKYEFAAEKLSADPLNGLSTAYQLVSQRVGPSVVHIHVESHTAGDVAEEAVNRFQRYRDFAGQGSGVIVDPAGYIMTNHHVVRGADAIRVSLADGRRVRGRLVGIDDDTDLALIKVDAGQLLAADWGDSDQLEVGALVWAVGSPFGLERSVTAGILSAKHRAGLAGTPYQDFLQTDAAVNPGNSGGPLVDAHGAVVGINTAIVGESYQGISFAIPSSIVQSIYERLREEGRVARGWLGVQLGEVTFEMAEQMKLPKPSGAYIAGVVSQLGFTSPAQTAGLVKGDIVVRWNDHEVSSPATLSNLVAQTEIGSTARAVVLRDSKELKVDVVVGERPAP